MISLSDSQLDIVTTFARGLEPQKRSDYLQRIAADLAVRHGYRFSDTDVSAAAQAVLTSLMQREPRAYFFLAHRALFFAQLEQLAASGSGHSSGPTTLCAAWVQANQFERMAQVHLRSPLAAFC